MTWIHKRRQNTNPEIIKIPIAASTYYYLFVSKLDLI